MQALAGRERIDRGIVGVVVAAREAGHRSPPIRRGYWPRNYRDFLGSLLAIPLQVQFQIPLHLRGSSKPNSQFDQAAILSPIDDISYCVSEPVQHHWFVKIFQEA